ncbi:MAG TPA: VCBS repeat-containing protein [Bryobacteraceae bacterium]|nr:VCBS repeat-containing protein [Bryobacteraceae bacterium]
MIRLLALAVFLVLAARPSMGQAAGYTCKDDGDGIYEITNSATHITITYELDIIGSSSGPGGVSYPARWYIYDLGNNVEGIYPEPLLVIEGDNSLAAFLEHDCGKALGSQIWLQAAEQPPIFDAYGFGDDTSFVAQRHPPGLGSHATSQYSLVSGQASQSATLADLNGDGFPDEIGVSPVGVTIRLLAADGSVISTNVFPAGFTPGVQTSQVVAADFNGDGKLDLAITYSNSSGTGGVSILLGNGDGTFRSPKLIPAGVYAQTIAAADFNGDGKIDIALANNNDNAATTVSILPGNGDGTFGAAVTYPAGPGFPVSLLALDLNGDGAPDLAVANVSPSGKQGNVTTLINKAGKMGSPASTSIPISLDFLAYADLNHDGNLDLVVACRTSNALVVLSGKGDGTFQAPAAYAVAAYPASLYPMPTSDGYTVIFTADDISGSTRFIIVSPQGAVYAPRLFSIGGSPTGVAAADLNGDGFPDIVITGGSSDVSVVMAQSARQFNAPVGYSLGQPSPSPLAVAIGDINGDGKPDVIVANGGVSYPETEGPGSVSVLLGNGDGTLRAPISTTVNQNAGSIALGDFNRDGKLDVAVAAYGTLPGEAGSDAGTLLVLLGNGNGTFQPPISLATGGLHPSAVAAADLNGDGKLDIAAVLGSTFGAPQTLAVFLGQGNGTFAAARTFPLQSTSEGQVFIAIGDFNGDGKLDIATGGAPQLDIMLGDGAGGFSEASALPTVTDGTVAATMDLNADGKLDLVLLSCCGESEGSYLLGNGDGTFQPAVHFSSGSSTTAIAVTKFGLSDGPDFVITQQGGNPQQGGTGGTWSPFLGATFQPGGPAPASNAPTSGAGSSQAFTFTFSDGSGYQNLSVVDVLINSALDGRQACYIAFVPSGANSGSVFLIDNAGDAGGPYQGLVLPGGGSISNGQCTISGAGSSVSGSGYDLTLTLSITFSASFAGNKVVYTSAQDKSGTNSGWQALGTWNDPGAVPPGPWVSGMSPASTSGLGPTTYTFTFTDTNGWQDITVADILINSAINGRNACYLAIVPAAQQVLLVDNAGDAGGPYSGMVLPGNGTVSNSQCSVTGTGSSIAGSGNTLTLTLPITFSPTFAGNQLFFLAARSNTANSNWQAVGSLSVP